MLCLYVTDWRDALDADDDGTSTPKKKTSNFEDFYKILKGSIVIPVPDVNQQFLDPDYEKPPAKSACIQNMCTIIYNLKSKVMKYYYIIDEILAYANKMYCNNINKCNINKFYEDMYKSIKYSKTQIKFLIRIYKLCKLCLKFKFVFTLTDRIRKFMKNVYHQMKKDVEFWNN